MAGFVRAGEVVRAILWTSANLRFLRLVEGFLRWRAGHGSASLEPAARCGVLSVRIFRTLRITCAASRTAFEIRAALQHRPPAITEANGEPPLFPGAIGQNYRSAEDLRGEKVHDVQICNAVLSK